MDPRPPTSVVDLADRRVDLVRQLVLFPSGRTASLTTREAQLLAHLFERAEQDVTREELLEQVWNYRASYATRAVDVTMRRLRSKVEPDPQSPVHLISVHGVGYRFVPVAAAPVRPAARPNTIPPQRGGHAPFIGREAEAAALAEVCTGHRIVSVLGPGGVGKSRLVAEVVARLGVDATWCELETAVGSPGVVAAVAAALGVVLTAGEEQMASIVGQALAGRGPTLIVLDAFERHVEHAKDTVGAWLEAAPSARFVVTSRQRLRLVGERVFELQPMTPADAEALFRERVAAAGVVMDDRSSLALGRLVERLDRLPLAIELAAPRARMMSLDALYSRLDERFKLLGNSSRDGRTLEAVLDASWELLSAGERQALAFCSVFVGGFTLEGAEAVLDDLGGWPLDLVEALRDKSLVRVTTSPDDPREPRLGLYDSVRDYARTKLDQRPDRELAFQRHAAYVVPIGEELADTVDRHGGRLRMSRLAAEADNLLAVVRRPTSEPAEVVRAVLALEPLLLTRGPVAVLRRLVEEALTQHGESGAIDRVALARLRIARAAVHRVSGENEAGVAEVEQAIELLRGGGTAYEARAHAVLALLHSDAARFTDATAVAERGLAVARAHRHRAQEGTLVGILAALATIVGEDSHAERLFLEAIRIDQEVGNELRAAIDLANFGLVLSEVGRREEAEERLEASLKLHQAWGNARGRASSHNNLATLRAQQGRYGDALEHLIDAERLFRGGGYHLRYAALVAQNRALLEWAVSGPTVALPALREVVAELAAIDNPLSYGMGRLYYAAALAATGDRCGADREIAAAADLLAPLKNARADGLAVVARGFVSLARAREGDVAARADAEEARAEGGRSELFGVRFLADRLGDALR